MNQLDLRSSKIQTRYNIRKIIEENVVLHSIILDHQELFLEILHLYSNIGTSAGGSLNNNTVNKEKSEVEINPNVVGKKKRSIEDNSAGKKRTRLEPSYTEVSFDDYIPAGDTPQDVEVVTLD